MMKGVVIAVLSLSLTNLAFAVKNDPAYRKARVKGADTKITLCVSDDSGNVISNAEMRVDRF